MTANEPADFFSTPKLTFLVVTWKQADPAPFEIGALRRVDPYLQGMNRDEATALIMSAPWWRVGPFCPAEEAAPVEAQLRAAGLHVQCKTE